MQEVMTFDAEDHRLPFPRDHDVLPSLLSFHVFELFDVMHLEESPFLLTAFTDTSFQSLLKRASGVP